MKITVSQHIYSNAPGFVGNWSWVTEMELPGVPRVGDWVITDPAGPRGEAERKFPRLSQDRVKDVYWAPTAVFVELTPVKTDNPDIIREMQQLRQGWTQLAGPWKDQG